MTLRKRKKRRNSIARAVFVALSILLQISWLLLIILELNHYSTYISLLTSVIAGVAVVRLYSRQTTSAYKIPWIMLIMALPVMGLSLYLLTQVAWISKGVHRRIRETVDQTQKLLSGDEAVLARLEKENMAAANQCRYLSTYGKSSVYDNTRTKYFGDCADAFEQMKTDLERAETFIFMEYFIIEDGECFRQLREILRRKAAQGVDVRLMYDDIGSIGKASWGYARELNADGIRCQVFNPALPVLSVFMNNRDHRKITVIDGKIGYTGGFNLADEYFGKTKPYGHWKDTGLRLEGNAVQSLTAIFLELWSVAARTKEDIRPYLSPGCTMPRDGYVQPYGDSPLDDEQTAENVYLNLLNHAQKYVWFMTPYLIITEELNRSMALAAKRGVDVRIITPGIPDKRAVYAVTRSYYAGLVENGVRIFEYTPGFCHGKMCICDGKMASIGTSNLDYRSLYLHFENNVLLYGCEAVQEMEQDFTETFALCREVTENYRSRMLRIWQCILRLFAPLL